MPKAPVSPRPPSAPAPPSAAASPPAEDAMPWLEEMPPRKIVAELDRYIVGQDAAKKAVAIAVRNRWRRAQAPEAIRDEIMPNNIIMIGPTGVGKTEIARRLARLAGAPFLKVEASKFTEVGYVGRDVETEVQQQSFPMLEMMQPPQGMEGPDINFGEMIQELIPKKKKRRTVHLHEARRILIDEELKKLVDMDDVVNEALDRVENHGVIFIDEIDKITGQRGQSTGPDVSREGVQRDLLPIVEGSTVQTRYGYVRTDHILFIAAGAFHIAKPSDLIPELQGRFPIRVELSSLTEADFVRIMTEPENALTKQYAALCAADGATLEFTADGVKEIARIAAKVNERMENIGARRLHTVMTTLLEDVMFELPDYPTKHIVFDGPAVRERLMRIVEDEDLRKYIL